MGWVDIFKIRMKSDSHKLLSKPSSPKTSFTKLHNTVKKTKIKVGVAKYDILLPDRYCERANLN